MERKAPPCGASGRGREPTAPPSPQGGPGPAQQALILPARPQETSRRSTEVTGVGRGARGGRQPHSELVQLAALGQQRHGHGVEDVAQHEEQGAEQRPDTEE